LVDADTTLENTDFGWIKLSQDLHTSGGNYSRELEAHYSSLAPSVISDKGELTCWEHAESFLDDGLEVG
jgi:hypothetical protein